jgi:hypothetical protein
MEIDHSLKFLENQNRSQGMYFMGDHQYQIGITKIVSKGGKVVISRCENIANKYTSQRYPSLKPRDWLNSEPLIAYLPKDFSIHMTLISQ